MEVLIPFKKGSTLHSHKNHNPYCDILVGHIDDDVSLTYGIYVNSEMAGLEFCEYYSGKNYNPNSTKNSYSRMWKPSTIPVKYKQLWQLLRSTYQTLPK